jgi:hypothetical protein
MFEWMVLVFFEAGIAPATHGVSDRCSANELLACKHRQAEHPQRRSQESNLACLLTRRTQVLERRQKRRNKRHLYPSEATWLLWLVLQTSALPLGYSHIDG